MKIELSYIYSDLDKRHEFGLVTEGESKFDETYIRWIWFGLGKHFDRTKVALHPYSMVSTWQQGGVLKSYKFCNNAGRQAQLIAKRINKIVNL